MKTYSFTVSRITQEAIDRIHHGFVVGNDKPIIEGTTEKYLEFVTGLGYSYEAVDTSEFFNCPKEVKAFKIWKDTPNSAWYEVFWTGTGKGIIK